MRIYIDFDDVLCETALAFTKIAKQMFGIDVPYREVQFFNLKKTFDLTDSQYEELMKAGHFPDNLLNYEDQNNTEDEIDMEELNKLKEQVTYLVGLVETLANPMIYNYIDENMPEWARKSVQKAVDKGVLSGTDEGWNLKYDDLRVIVWLDRLGLLE